MLLKVFDIKNQFDVAHQLFFFYHKYLISHYESQLGFIMRVIKLQADQNL